MPFCYQTRFRQWFSLRVCDREEKSWDRKKNEDTKINVEEENENGVFEVHRKL